MKKYLNVIKILIKNAFIRDSKIPGFVSVLVLQELFSITTNVVFFNVIFSNISALGGWSFYQVLFLYSFAKTISSLSNGLTRMGLKNFGQNMIKNGEYDFYLIKPIDTMTLVSFSKPGPIRFITAFFYIALGIYSITKSGIAIGVSNVIWFFALASFSLVLFYLLETLVVVPAFKLVRVWTLPSIIPRVSEFMRYPIGIFSFPFKVLLFGAFPIIAITYIPSSALFYAPSPALAAYLVLITTLFFIIVRNLWLIGERNYSSASS